MESQQDNAGEVSSEASPASAFLGPNPAFQKYFQQAEALKNGYVDPSAETIEMKYADSMQVEEEADPSDKVVIAKDKDGKISVIE